MSHEQIMLCKAIAHDPSKESENNSFKYETFVANTSVEDQVPKLVSIREQILEDTKFGKLDDSNGELTYRILNHTEDLLRGRMRRAINYALTEWDIEIKPKLSWVSKWETEESDLTIEFRNAEDDQLFKDEPNVLAYMYYPIAGFPLKGKCVVNDQYLWSINGDPILAWKVDPVHYSEGDQTKFKTFSLRKVIRHELGHGLGLPHSTLPGNTMSPSYEIMSDFNTERDIARIVAKYDVRTWRGKMYSRIKNWYRKKFS